MVMEATVIVGSQKILKSKNSVYSRMYLTLEYIMSLNEN
jgi:NADH:ubiquinone oxidoreductase subunit 6 (subunit J)